MSKLERRRAPDRPVLRAGEEVLLVQMAVAGVTGVGLTDLVSGKRGGAQAAFARQAAMYLCHLVFRMNVRRVAAAFGRDRTTVRHAFRRIEDLREDHELDRALSLIEAMLRHGGRPS